MPREGIYGGEDSAMAVIGDRHSRANPAGCATLKSWRNWRDWPSMARLRGDQRGIPPTHCPQPVDSRKARAASRANSHR
jgi:hypothetical protein